MADTHRSSDDELDEVLTTVLFDVIGTDKPGNITIDKVNTDDNSNKQQAEVIDVTVIPDFIESNFILEFVNQKEVTVNMVARKLKEKIRLGIWYFVFTSIFSAVLRISEFEGTVMNINNTSTIKFTCTIYQRPFGDSIAFLLNEKTENVLRFLDGKCYKNDRECTKCQCSVSQNNITFTWLYTMTDPCHNCTFGAHMSFADENNRKTKKVYLYMEYNGKDLGPLQTEIQELQHDTSQGADDEYLLTFTICFIAIAACFITTILVLKRKQIRICTRTVKKTGSNENLLKDTVKKTGIKKNLPKDTGETELHCHPRSCKHARISVKLSRQILLKHESVDIFGLISISESKLVIADRRDNALEIYSDDKFDLKFSVLYKINGVTRVSKDIIAVTLANNDNIHLYTLKNNKCVLWKTIQIGYNLLDITSDTHYLVFKHKDEKTMKAMLKLYNCESNKVEDFRDVSNSTFCCDKLALDMDSKTVYACAENTDQVVALSLKEDKDWYMPIPKPTEIVLVQCNENTRMILVLCKNQNEIYCVSKDKVRRVEEEGETIKKSSMFNRMSYNAEVSQLFVQTAKTVINVYDMTF
ncbi:unnamed protein product [Mytilus coruscus]|uniref:Uncharacterized protein n=1 Tax=Mytilus coruscus TaxID=42192 RepID=A0A6J8DAZ5_MYTCO|nr:unnamed protein product [Mytilus coruscus]